MKVVFYLKSLNAKAQLESNKGQILNKFALGVTAKGDEAVLHNSNDIIPADAAMIVGWVHEESKNTSHLMLRKKVFDTQILQKKKMLIADSNLFLYANTGNPMYYLRYSYNGVFPNTGIYCDDVVDPARWKTISTNTGITLKDYRKNGHHILLCLQRNGGWSMAGYNVVDWTASIIREIRKHSDREIIIRPHPGDKDAANYLSPKNLMSKIGLLKGVRLSRPNASLIDDLHKCWAVVNHNSSPAVGAAIEGYPIFVTDPQRSQCAEIANTEIKNIESPILYDRQAWIERLSMFHWNFKETSSGEAWEHMRKYL